MSQQDKANARRLLQEAEKVMTPGALEARVKIAEVYALLALSESPAGLPRPRL